MHEHDLDLIAEHASGLLSGADAARAADLVAACVECRREYATHQEVRAVLATVPSPGLTDFERTRLRRAILDEVAPSRREVAPWQRRFLGIAGAAAAVVVVIAGVGILGQMDDGGGDEAFTAADSTASTAASSALVPPDGPESSDDAALTFGDADRSTAEMAEDDGTGMGGGLLWLIDASDVKDPAALATLVDEMLAGVAQEPQELSIQEAEDFGAGCAGTVDGPLFGVILAKQDGVATETFVTGDPDHPTVTTVAGADCAQLEG